MITYKIILRDFQNKNLEHAIVLRVIINRKVQYFGLDIATQKKDWNPETQRVRKTDSKHQEKNLIIENALSKCHELIAPYRLNGKNIYHTDFKYLFNAPKFEKNSFNSFVAWHIDTSNELRADTKHTYRTLLTKICSFKPEISFDEITPIFIKSYEKYMMQVRKNNPTTIHKSITWIKNMLNWAVKLDVIRSHEINKITVKRTQGKRKPLTINELKTLELLYPTLKKKYLKNILRNFLFACYTGLRYRDLKSIKYKNIEISGNSYILDIVMHKTELQVRIPLSEKTLNLIDVNSNKEYYILHVPTNQTSNKLLKRVIAIANIDKPISFHTARHTFATIGLTLGIPLDVVSKLLGHTDLRTTMIYAKYVDTIIIDNMSKWDKML